jgi:hypothetical protein
MATVYKKEIVSTYEDEKVASLDAAGMREDGYDADYESVMVGGETKYIVYYMKYMGDDNL